VIGAGGLLLLAMNAAWPESRWVGLAEDVASALAALGLWIGAGRAVGPGRKAWRLLALAVLLWVAGDFVWDGYTFAGAARPDVSLADLFYLAGYPVLTVGLLQMARDRAGRHIREGLLDGCVFAAAATMAVWQVLVLPTAHSTSSIFTSVVWSSYPLGDVLVIAAVMWVVLTPGRRTEPTYLLLAAVAMTFVVDVLYVYLPTVSTFDVARLDPWYPISYALLAAAALHPARDELSTARAQSPTRMHRARFGLLAASLCTAPIVGILGTSDTWVERLVLIGLSSAVSAAVVLRFAFTVRSRERAQQALAHRATHDELTGVVNRVLLIDRIDHALTRARRQGDDALAVLYLDLDRFKEINDTLGHQAGDALLVDVAQRITSVVRPGDTVGRLGGDEFVVLCENIKIEESIRVAERLLAIVEAPLGRGDAAVRITTSIGIAFSKEGATGDDLISRADAAMYAAKRDGGDRYEVYDETLRTALTQRRDTERALRHALARGELVLFYQPIVRSADGTVAAVEALLRWRRDGGALIPPDQFIGLAEETGLIVSIGEWVIESACAQLAEWSRAGCEMSISVNVSAVQLQRSGLEEAVRRALALTGADPSRLILEVTESVLVQDDDRAHTQLTRLRALGLRVAIDDFGTGYSSLAYLQHLPVDIVKIDRTFITALETDDSASAVLAAVIHLAHILGFLVVAEGAETRAQVDELRRLECDEIQGFYFARPAPVGALDEQVLRGAPIRPRELVEENVSR
jgi:diguanylate cyclase (GGDEF)-like protein